MTSFDFITSRQDDFTLLGLPRSFAVDGAELDTRYRDVQARVHPDKHVHLPEADRRLAMQWATRVNEAYQTLKNPLRRAQYLLRLAGHDPLIEQNRVMAAEFLVAQMEWRETVAEAREAGQADVLEDCRRRLRREMSGQYTQLQHALDETHDYFGAAEIVRQLMFQEKLLHEIDDALVAIDG